MTRLLKEPLLHFLIVGTLLCVAYARLHDGDGSAQRTAHQIRIGPGDVEWLRETWTRQWQREPTREELRGLVTELVKEELLAREARAMGLDENDTVVRRRLAQKLQFIVQDTAQQAAPSEDDLLRFYASHPNGFLEAARVSFAHIYFNRTRRPAAAADARQILGRLSASDSTTPVAAMGDRLLIDSELHDVDEQTVSALFGPEFTDAVFALPPGTWNGPIESGYGLHLVRVTAVKPARQRPFAEVREQVLARWHDQRQRDAGERFFAGLLRKYDVAVDASLESLVGPLQGLLAGSEAKPKDAA